MNKYHILIVDDDQILVETIQEWLEMNGYQVTIAAYANDEIWLSQWQWERFDCIITGIYQPGLNGLTFTKLIRDSDGPPVIVISGYEPETSSLTALEMGAVAFIKKPFDLRELLKIVEACCNECI
jgi:DNA-binding response OmpR family regulator